MTSPEVERSILTLQIFKEQCVLYTKYTLLSIPVLHNNNICFYIDFSTQECIITELATLSTSVLFFYNIRCSQIKNGVGDRTRTCIIRTCKPAPSLSEHTHIIFSYVISNHHSLDQSLHQHQTYLQILFHHW